LTYYYIVKNCFCQCTVSEDNDDDEGLIMVPYLPPATVVVMVEPLCVCVSVCLDHSCM